MKVLTERLDAIAIALFVIMCGTFWLIPVAVPGSVWLIGTGLILLGRDIARYMNSSPRNEVTISLGIILLLGGLVDYTGGPSPVLPIFVILVDVWLLTINLFGRRAK